MERNELLARVERLERTNRRLHALIGCAVLSLGGMFAAGFAGQADGLKTTKLTIVDAQGRERIIIAGKIPDPKEGERRTSGPGMQILNENGYEQFGLHLDTEGGIGMGFDARPGAGDDRNRERINLAVSPNGQPSVRLMDGHTRARSLWFLDEKEEPWLGFYKWEGDGKDTKYVGMTKLGLKEVEGLAKP